jgi:hypothetical protein
MKAQPKEIRCKSYREFLLENLQDEAHAAGYLMAALMEKEEDAAFLKQLVQSTIDDVIEAQTIRDAVLPEVSTLRDRFATAQANGSDIHGFVQLLDVLGFELAIVPKDRS